MVVKSLKDKSVAILAPFFEETGGAERLFVGLLTELRGKVGRADLITLPSDESSFESVMETYRQWQEFDLSSYDLVISTKAPTYVVRHPRHVVYLVHTIRVFYDMFDQTFPNADPTLCEHQRQIHELDTNAFASARRVFTIGHEVAHRVRKWNGLDTEVLHPPLGFDEFKEAPAENYFFMPGRLHPWKRVDLAIRAIKCTDLDTRLLIAGSGEAEADLHVMAGNDPRVVFLGHVSDEQLIELYSKALGVLFLPMREDYGYITLEAFQSGKPVITCVDSGETLEFVKHGKSGLICYPEPESIAQAMMQMSSDKPGAEAMGRHGKQSIQHIRWAEVADRLLEAGFSEAAAIRGDKQAKTKVAVLDMQPIEPAVGGGRQRLLGLYHNLGEDFETRYVGTYDWPGERRRKLELSSSLQEVDVPLSAAHHDAANALMKQAGNKTIIDVAFARLCHLSPDFLAEAKETAEWADVVIFSHPWVFPLISKYLRPSQLVVYDSHNVEGFLRAQILDKNNPAELDLIKDVIAAEYLAGQRADHILTCSLLDSILFNRIYDWNPSKMEVIPNGVMASTLTPPDDAEKRDAGKRLGMDHKRPTAIFLGSPYPPNVEAALFIARELAPELTHVNFVIAGGVSTHVDVDLPENLVLTGFLEEAAKLDWLRAADFAINPMFSGSGTNIKMFDFMAVGMPIVATPTGARGITQKSNRGVRIASKSGFADAIRQLLGSDTLQSMGSENRRWVERDFAWESISAELGQLIATWLSAEGKLVGKLRSEKRPNDQGPLRLAHVSTCGQSCGIGEYTLRLIENLPADLIENKIFACETPSKKDSTSELRARFDIETGWFQSADSPNHSRINEDLADRIRAWSADAVLIQYHKAFFSEEVLIRFAAELLAGKTPVAIFIHSLVDLDLSMLITLEQIGAHIISHNELDIESVSHLKVDLLHLPLGIDGPENRKLKDIAGRDWLTEPPIIATTGFIRSHKGLLSLIKALPLVQELFPGASLRMVCARYPSRDSAETFSACVALIESLGLEASVSLITDYLPIEDVYRKLQSADVAVLPYQESAEGGSAAAGTCFTAGLPLLTSQAHIFYGVRNNVQQLPDSSPESIAESIIDLLGDDNAYRSLVERTSLYAKHASFESIWSTLISVLFTNSSASKGS